MVLWCLIFRDSKDTSPQTVQQKGHQLEIRQSMTPSWISYKSVTQLTFPSNCSSIVQDQNYTPVIVATIARLGLVQPKSQFFIYDFERSCCVASRWSCFVYIHLLVLDTSWSSNSADLYLWYSCQHANTKSTTWIPVYWEAAEIQIQITKDISV